MFFSTAILHIQWLKQSTTVHDIYHLRKFLVSCKSFSFVVLKWGYWDWGWPARKDTLLLNFFEAEPDKMLTMTTQEEFGEKMNSSSKTMVQAVTLLTALRMFANGKIMVMIMVMIMMVVLKEVQALRFFEEKNTLRNNLFSMTRVIIDQQFFSISITLLHNSLSWKPYWIVKNKASYILDFQFTIPHQNRDGKLAVLSY